MAIRSIYVVSDDAAALNELVCGAKAMAEKVTAVVFGDEAAAQAAAGCGADAILYAPVSEEGAPEDYAKAIAAEVKKDDSAVVFVSNTIRGRALAGKIGVLLDTAVLTNPAEIAEENGVLVCGRTVYGGMAVRKTSVTKAYAVVALNSGSFELTELAPCTTIAALPGEPEGTIKRVGRTTKQEGSVNLAVAKRIVDVGRGLAAEEDLEMVNKLAAVLGAEVGCSRPVAENNKWLPKASYLGITGTVVKPEVIFVMGCSGQVQHIGGINKSKVIVAVNKDKGAPIFKNCDFGLVGDMYKIVPALIEKLS